MRFNWNLVQATTLLLTLTAPVLVRAQQSEPLNFKNFPPIVRVISQRCIGCHSGAEPNGEVDLTRPDLIAMGKGLDENPVESVFWQKVRDDEMPPDGELPDAEKKVIQSWVESGAPRDFGPIDPLAMTTSARAGLDWWSLQPIIEPPIPFTLTPNRVRNPIDAFVLKTLEANALTFSPGAAPRNQIRRLYFDLIGLPAPVEVIEAFEQTPTDAAYHKVVDDLLASPEYGERWARHWLDIVRYGESDGFERNGPRNESWRYRDWVIDALNQDMPFDEFARRQLAGDVLCDDPVEGMAATGFLVAGVHNTVVGSSKQMQLLARQDEMEDLIGVIGQTFVGMTLNCARCHDHKFDPITQQEYYQLVATVAGVNHGIRQSRRASDQKQIEALAKNISRIQQEIIELESPVRKLILADRRSNKLPPPPAPKPVASWEFEADMADSVGALEAQPFGDAKLENGAIDFDGDGDYAMTQLFPVELHEKTLEVWVYLDNLEQRGGAAISIETTDGSVFDAIVFGEQEPQKWMAGSNGFSRTGSFAGESESAHNEPIQFAITYSADGAITGFRNGVQYGQTYSSSGPQAFAANSARLLFGLRHSPAGGNRFLKGRLLRAQLYDRSLSPAEIAASAGTETDCVSESELSTHMDNSAENRRQILKRDLQEFMVQKKTLEEQSLTSAYTAVYSEPSDTHFLPRGDAMNPGPVVQPGTTRIISNLKHEFDMEPGAAESQRRLKLAEWLTDAANPLFRRVIVNRLWSYHFGRGIIATPNDFGFNGGLPSNPELLDWLATELSRNGHHLKPLHRLIVTSSAYRQTSMFDSEKNRLDAENKLLWRKSPTRLDAESIRDSILAVSGKLNPQRGGPSYRDVDIIDQNNGTTYYSPFDRDDPLLDRRTIYRFNPRGGRSALLDCFDCPDPSAAAPQRSVTTTPLQALSLLNNDFVIRMAEAFGTRAKIEAPNTLGEQIEWMFRTAYGRSVTNDELKAATKLAEQHGLSAVARAVFNSNEFIIVQ